MLRDFFIAYHACIQSLSHVQLFATPWTVAHQNPMSMGFSRQEFWSGLPFPSPGDLSDPGIKPGSPALQAGALPSKLPGKPGKNCPKHFIYFKSFKSYKCPSLVAQW